MHPTQLDSHDAAHLHALEPEVKLLPPPRPLLLPLSDYTPKPTRWLWPDYLPLGKITLLGGDPGVGKSLLAANLAARVTAALPWPNAPADPDARPANVLFCCAEDDPADTVLPRLVAAGGDPSRAYILHPPSTAISRNFAMNFPADLDHLETALRNSDARLLILDPLAAFLGPSGDYGSEIQSRLAPLIDLATQCDCAVLAITHRDLRPAPHSNRPRGYAACSLLAAARAAFRLAAPEPGTDNLVRRILVPIKNNFAYRTSPASFRIHVDATITWDEPHIADLAASFVIEADQPTSQIDRAAVWLACHLGNGPHPVSEILEAASSFGFSEQTLRRASQKLRVSKTPTVPNGPWAWQLPAHRQPSAYVGQVGQHGQHGQHAPIAQKPTS